MACHSESVHQKLQEIIRQAQSEGRTEELLEVIESSFEVGPRRQHSDWENAVVVPSSTTSSKASGSKSSGHQATHPPDTRLPPGIRDVDHWGASLRELNKVKSRRLTYTELVALSSEDHEIRIYLTRFVLKHNGPSEKVKDLRRYLEFIGYPNHLEGPEPDVQSTYVFPRKFRS